MWFAITAPAIALLVEGGADTTALNNEGLTAYDLGKDHPEGARLLIPRATAKCEAFPIPRRTVLTCHTYTCVTASSSHVLLLAGWVL